MRLRLFTRLLFAECYKGNTVSQSTTGNVFGTYFQDMAGGYLEFVAVLRCGHAVVTDKLCGGYMEYAWDGKILTKNEMN
jgi:hypothetical protein